MSGLILGTAGHIDHGKSALVRALTGVDPDRLQEEKARGITIELGFAELDAGEGVRFGVVDVPGHEAFVRAMVAGAAGVDVVLLIVAADEGVMPQTREHLSIIELLGVPALVVALTKCDLVEEEWLELVAADVEELLRGTPYEGAPQVRTSALRETGLDSLCRTLRELAGGMEAGAADDLVRLPLDRVFTIQGTGTVVTGTLWSGTLKTGDRVRIVPQDLDARVRGLQVHGREVPTAQAGDRTAVALTGAGADRAQVERGATLVTSTDWTPSWMATARVRMLEDADWTLAHNQRVHLHHGTAEVLARCALLEAAPLGPGESGWVQFRLEEPLAMRVRDRFVIRAYSPVTTIGGGVIAEAAPPKRRRLADETRAALAAVLDGDTPAVLSALMELSGWSGVPRSALPVLAGLPPHAIESAVADLELGSHIQSGQSLFSQGVREEGEQLVLAAVDRGHESDPLRASVPMADVRAALPRWAPKHLGDGIIAGLVDRGVLASAEGGVHRPDHVPEPTAEQADASARLVSVLREGGLGPPFVDELPEDLRNRGDLRSLLRRLEQSGSVLQVADGYYVASEELEGAVARIVEQLGGRRDLGPADFREALDVSRKWLIPLLNYLDGKGVTSRHDGGRDVPPPP
ncbi:MAG: selenocysteine-specific translation elongation factor [Gemmatimonadota bacterium]|nr:selenocysteine-specific translation elongation factor [Gemmatimonadota bacterium]MDH3423808.1 selenocysteine-specific translation elongation factor [Gemmatimonadota bacterium]